MILYRPVGQAEYGLIALTDFTAYPPRLPDQPIFYPVLTARDCDGTRKEVLDTVADICEKFPLYK